MVARCSSNSHSQSSLTASRYVSVSAGIFRQAMYYAAAGVALYPSWFGAVSWGRRVHRTRLISLFENLLEIKTRVGQSLVPKGFRRRSLPPARTKGTTQEQVPRPRRTPVEYLLVRSRFVPFELVLFPPDPRLRTGFMSSFSQNVVIVFEYALAIAGLWYIGRLFFSSAGRAAKARPAALPGWKVPPADFLFLGWLVLSLGFLGQLLSLVVAPVCEELVFRVGILRFLRTRTPRWVAFGVSAGLFMLLHGNWMSAQ